MSWVCKLTYFANLRKLQQYLHLTAFSYIIYRKLNPLNNKNLVGKLYISFRICYDMRQCLYWRVFSSSIYGKVSFYN